ncbi:MAG: type VI secretion system protein [Anaeromyxobacter sp.]|nr:type VI secretion system protein [Anaeromyxobacter sp.]MBL0276275.1 type VI secretion system protein [Anaeromyxobacter sp.]
MPLPALTLAAALLRRRAALAAAGALALLGALSGLIPLLDVPGFELGLVGAWLGVLLAGPLGLAAARAERARVGGSPGVAALAAALAASLLLLVLLASSAARAALGPCRALFGAAFFPVLALPSAWLAAALAAAAGWATRGRALPTGLALGAAVVASLAATLRDAWRGPAAFALDHLLGAWPGPLYDEALRLDARLLLFRLGTTGLALLVGAGAAWLAGRRGGRRVALAAALAAAGGAGAAAARVALAAQGLDGHRGRMAAALGGLRQGPSCTVHLPAEKPAEAADALLADCEFHVHDLAAALGLPAAPRVTVFVHRSDEEKRRHVGASGTSFAKPWLGELHVTDAALPHPILRHELVHLVAAALEPGWLGVPARHGLLVSMGLVEGLAVSLELPRGGWTGHQWARAARDLGFLPDVAAALGPAGFWRAAPARAYGAAGSFLAFLRERHGAAPVAALYRSGDFQAAYGRPAAALLAEWQAFLDGVEVPPGLLRAARARYARPALFAVPCAREVAALEEGAWALAGRGRRDEACQALRRVAAVTGRAGPLRAVGDLLAAAGDLDGAAAAYEEAARAAPEVDAHFRAQLVAAEADLFWRRGEFGAAAAGWSRALAVEPDRPEARLLQAKLAAVADRELAVEARPYLLGLEAQAAALDRLRRLDRPLTAYLLSRQALGRGEAGAAVPLLERAAAGGLPPLLAGEARLLLGEARCQAGAAAGGGGPAALRAGAAELAAVEAGAAAEADRVRAAAGLRRCRFLAGG